MAFITGNPNLGGVGSPVGGGSIFSGLGGALSGIGSGLLSFGGSALSGLFGGSSGPSKSDQAMDIIRAQQEQQAAEDNLAGSGDKSTIPKPGPIPTMAERMGAQVGQLGKQFAGDFIEKLSSRYIDSKMTSMFAPKPINPAIRGIQDRAYTNARFPELNPWEIAGGGAASGGQGGRAAPQIQQRTAAETAAIGARSQQRAAGITTAPKIEEVNIKYQKLHPEIGEIRAGTALKGAEAQKLGITNPLQQSLTSYEARLKQAQGDVAFQHKEVLVKEGKMLEARLNNEVARLPETHAKAKIQSVLSDYAEALAAGKIGAPLLGIVGTLLTLFGIRGLTKRGKKPSLSTSTHKPGKIRNWPRYGPKAGQAFQ